MTNKSEFSLKIRHAFDKIKEDMIKLREYNKKAYTKLKEEIDRINKQIESLNEIYNKKEQYDKAIKYFNDLKEAYNKFREEFDLKVDKIELKKIVDDINKTFKQLNSVDNNSINEINKLAEKLIIIESELPKLNDLKKYFDLKENHLLNLIEKLQNNITILSDQYKNTADYNDIKKLKYDLELKIKNLQENLNNVIKVINSTNKEKEIKENNKKISLISRKLKSLENKINKITKENQELKKKLKKNKVI